MTSTTIDDAPFIEPSTTERRNYLNDEYGVLSWLLTKDHKRIAILYLVLRHGRSSSSAASSRS